MNQTQNNVTWHIHPWKPVGNFSCKQKLKSSQLTNSLGWPGWSRDVFSHINTSLTNVTTRPEPRGSVDQSTWVWSADMRLHVLSRRSYHQWWLMKPHRRWPGVSLGIIRYAFNDLWRMEGWVGLAARGDKQICWHELPRDIKLVWLVW